MPKHFLIQVLILKPLEDHHQLRKFIREKVVMGIIAIAIRREDLDLAARVLE